MEQEEDSSTQVVSRDIVLPILGSTAPIQLTYLSRVGENIGSVANLLGAIDAAIRLIEQTPEARAALLLGPADESSAARIRQILQRCEPGQFVVTLAVQDLVRDIASACEFYDLGSIEIGGRLERLFLVATPSEDKSTPDFSSSIRTESSFIGRRKELQQLKRKLDEARLLTVYGIPGIGKSALLHRFYLEQESAFPDGAWLVDLAQVRHPELLLHEVARSLEVVKLPGESLQEAILNSIGAKQALLILDNGHFVQDAIKALAANLLGSTLQLAIVVGARKLLKAPSEARFRLDGMETPAFAEDWRAIREYDSVVLFEERAKSFDADFNVNAKNASDVALLCQRLDGSPLAIELAASKTALLAPGQILGRLEHRFMLLKEGSGPGKLEETIEWSCNLLSPGARCLLSNLAVFRGSFTYDGAEAVASQEITHFQAAFEELLDSAFLLPSGKPTTKKYFYLSETIRAFSLRRTPIEPSISAAHRKWCLDLAKSASEGLYGPQQAVWVEEMDAAYEDMRAVVSEASLPRGDVSSAIDTLLACCPYLMLRNYYREGLQLAERLSSTRGASKLSETSRVLNMAAACAYYLVDLRKAREFGLKALRHIQRHPAPGYAARVRCGLGMAAHRAGNLARARRHYSAAARELRTIDLDRYLVIVGNLIGFEASIGNLERAAEHWHAVEPLLGSSSDPSSVCCIQLNAAHFALCAKQLSLCARLCRDAFALSADLGDALSCTMVTRTAVGLAVTLQQFETAALLIGASRSMIARSESQPFEADLRTFEANSNLVQAELGPDNYNDLFFEGRQMSNDDVLSAINRLVADLSTT